MPDELGNLELHERLDKLGEKLDEVLANQVKILDLLAIAPPENAGGPE